jgi:hypothetical protein
MANVQNIHVANRRRFFLQQVAIGLPERNLLLIFDTGLAAAGAGLPLPQTGDSSRAGDLLLGQGMAWL